MTLAALLEDTVVRAAHGTLEREVAGLAFDSRRVTRGDAFFALAGAREDGTVYAQRAIAAGAVAVVAAAAPSAADSADVTWIAVDEPRTALALAARRWYRVPAGELQAVGVTGTNGKTTTTYLIESVCAAAGIPCGILGTTGVRVGGAWRPAALTTPDPLALQALLREMVDHGDQAVALELSSHALDQRRAFGLDLDVAVFTNLSQDHLDYHGTMERYLDAKLRLFDGRNLDRARKTQTAVVNADDPAAPAVIAAARRASTPVVTYGEAPDANVRIAGADPMPSGLAIRLVDGAEPIEFTLPMLGRHNGWNAAAAFASGRALGIAAADAVRGLSSTPGVPGRLERVSEGQKFEVVVDYAHTPDALERALQACRAHTRHRVLLVFGCGGDRDAGKRPLMGAIAARDADRAWITNDNPRSEDPERIADMIEAGAANAPAGRMTRLLDRRAAIAAALAEARPGELVLIAGKGHETTQTIGDQILPFDDREVARELLRAGRGA